MNINEKRKKCQKIKKMVRKAIYFLWNVVQARIVILHLNVYLDTPMQYSISFMQSF